MLAQTAASCAFFWPGCGSGRTVSPPTGAAPGSNASSAVTKYFDLTATHSNGPLTVATSAVSSDWNALNLVPCALVTNPMARSFSARFASVLASPGPMPTSRSPPFGTAPAHGTLHADFVGVGVKGVGEVDGDVAPPGDQFDRLDRIGRHVGGRRLKRPVIEPHCVGAHHQPQSHQLRARPDEVRLLALRARGLIGIVDRARR